MGLSGAQTREHHSARAGDPDQAMRHHRRASEALQNDHAYAVDLARKTAEAERCGTVSCAPTMMGMLVCAH